MKHRQREEFAVGQDSFLDTTANLVGILIILVVVIGTKTKIDAVEYGKQQAEAEASPELAEPARQVQALANSLQQQAIQMAEYELEMEYRQQERDRLLAQVSVIREAVAEELEAIDGQRRQVIEKQIAKDSLEKEIQDVQRQMGSAQQSERPKVILEHLPTPMARTVFTREMHVQLKNHQVTVIPWDRLVATLKQQVPLAVQRKLSRGNVRDTLGPIGGFLMHYNMHSVPGGFELERFELESTPSAPSESLREALAPAGRFRLELASRDPAETVITIWVYPDSFAEFRELKARIFEEGFLSAARPLPANVRIGASPKGSRSSAQ